MRPTAAEWIVGPNPDHANRVLRDFGRRVRTSPERAPSSCPGRVRPFKRGDRSRAQPSRGRIARRAPALPGPASREPFPVSTSLRTAGGRAEARPRSMRTPSGIQTATNQVEAAIRTSGALDPRASRHRPEPPQDGLPPAAPAASDPATSRSGRRHWRDCLGRANPSAWYGVYRRVWGEHELAIGVGVRRVRGAVRRSAPTFGPMPLLDPWRCRDSRRMWPRTRSCGRTGTGSGSGSYEDRAAWLWRAALHRGVERVSAAASCRGGAVPEATARCGRPRIGADLARQVASLPLVSWKAVPPRNLG